MSPLCDCVRSRRLVAEGALGKPSLWRLRATPFTHTKKRHRSGHQQTHNRTPHSWVYHSRNGKTGWKYCRECGKPKEKPSWDANRQTDGRDSPQNAGDGENDDLSRALFRQAYVAAKEARFQMLADNVATTHPFVQEELCEAGQALATYPVAAQRLHKLQEKLVNQLVAREERRKDLFKRLDEKVRLEVRAKDELDQALARQRNNTTPDPMEVPGLAAVEAAKGLKANLGAAAARAKMHRDKIQAAQASKKEGPQQKKPRLAAKQLDPTTQTTTMVHATEVDGSDEASNASKVNSTEVAHTYSRPNKEWKKQWARPNKHARTRLSNRLGNSLLARTPSSNRDFGHIFVGTCSILPWSLRRRQMRRSRNGHCECRAWRRSEPHDEQVPFGNATARIKEAAANKIPTMSRQPGVRAAIVEQIRFVETLPAFPEDVCTDLAADALVIRRLRKCCGDA